MTTATVKASTVHHAFVVNQALCLPRIRGHIEPSGARANELLGLRVHSRDKNSFGTIVDVDVAERNIHIWWDRNSSKTPEIMSENQTAVSCRLMSVVRGGGASEIKQRDTTSGQIVTTYRRWARVRAGPHFPIQHICTKCPETYGTIVGDACKLGGVVTVLLDHKSLPVELPIGNGGKFALVHANPIGGEVPPRKGQLAVIGVRGARVARCHGEIYNGKNWGTIFEVRKGGSEVRVVWHDKEIVETISELPNRLRYVDDPVVTAAQHRMIDTSNHTRQ